ncbi:MAG: hypothetical protein U0797_09180 [Gemmataceae bacterium]
MRAFSDTFPALADWRHSWRQDFACDEPSVIPYPRPPVGVTPRAARRHPDRAACTLYGQATTFAELDERRAGWRPP